MLQSGVRGEAQSIEILRDDGSIYEVEIFCCELCDHDAPMLLVLDAPYLFGTVAETVYIQAMSGEISPPVVAGLAIKGGLADHAVRRVRDFTPARESDQSLQQSPVWKLIEALQSRTGCALDELLGGAPSFGEFIKTKILPTLREQGALATDDIGLVGHSASAVFGLNQLCSDGNPFSHMLLGSVGIGWYGEGAFEVRNLSRPGGVDGSPIRIFQGVGQVELVNAALGPPLERGLEVLRELSVAFADQISLTQRVFADETHASVMAPMVSAGVRTLYANGASFMDDLIG